MKMMFIYFIGAVLKLCEAQEKVLEMGGED